MVYVGKPVLDVTTGLGMYKLIGAGGPGAEQRTCYGPLQLTWEARGEAMQRNDSLVSIKL